MAVPAFVIDITQPITHDSYALSPNIAATQDNSIIDQLNDGVRGIKLTAVTSPTDPSDIHLCHRFCGILDAGSLTDTLNNMTTWLEANPEEVVTIMWNNLNNIKATHFADAYQSSKIMPLVYTHNQSSWPTLQEMIGSGKRLVNFIDAEADPEQVPWLMNQFSYVFETPYDNTDMNGFDCTIDRIGKDLNPNDLMYVMNHFIYGGLDIGSVKIRVPFKEQAQHVNSQASLENHIQQCTNIFQKNPNFIEVDFYTIGDALKAVADLNGVPPSPLLLLPSSKISSAAIRRGSLFSEEHVMIDNSAGGSLPPLNILCHLLLLFAIIIRLFIISSTQSTEIFE